MPSPRGSNEIPWFFGHEQLEGSLIVQGAKTPVASGKVFQLLIAANENSVGAIDKDGITPLHYLCFHIDTLDELSPEVLVLVRTLVDVDPSAALIEDHKGHVPPNTLKAQYEKLTEYLERSTGEDAEVAARHRLMSEDLGNILGLCTSEQNDRATSTPM